MKFRNLPIRKKVGVVIVLVVGLSILLSVLSSFIYQSIAFRKRSQSELITLASVIGGSVNTSMMFGDRPEATRVLDHFRLQRFQHLGETTEVHLFSLPGKDRFASSPADARPPVEFLSKGVGIYSADNGVWLIHELKDESGRTYAHIMLRSSLQKLRNEERSLIMLLGVINALTLLVAYYLGRRLQQSLVRPISSLVYTVQEIAEKGNHALRAQKFSDDEVGNLADNVNQMLDTLNKQDQALRESEALFRSQFEYGNIGIAITSVEKGWLKVNACLCNMFGYTEEELRKKTWTEMTYPDDLAPDLEQYERMLKGEIEDYEIDKRFFRKDGSIIYTHLTVSCFRNPNRSVKFVIASLLDITERKQAEETLRESEEKMQSIFRVAPIGIGLVSNRMFLQVNTRLCEMVGYSSDELIGKSARIFYPSDEEFKYVGREKYAQIQQYGAGTVETRWKCKNGRIIDVLLSSTPINLHDLSLGVTFTALDITDRKRAEEEKEKLVAELQDLVTVISNSQREWRETFDSINDLIFIIDMDHTVIKANKAVEKMLGIPLIEIVGEKCHKLFHGTDSAPEWCAGEQCLKTRKPITAEMFEPHLNMFIEINSIPRFSSNDDLIGAIHIIRDITEHKKNEEQFRQTQKMEAVGQLAGGIAHDFNNILTAIISSGELLKMKMAKESPLEHYVGYILDASERGANLVKGLLAFSRKDIYYLNTVDLNEIVAGIEPFIRRLVPEDIDMRVETTDKVLTVMADKTQIEQVLINLVANSRDALPSGGLISISTEFAKLDETFVPELKQGEYALISISDTGTGMDEKTRERIFEPFFTTKEVGKGTGLGLSSAYGIIKQHNGSINVYSTLGIGTTMKIYLPLVSVSDEETDTEEAVLPKGGDETILFAEDDPTVRNVTKDLLEEFGYKVIVAVDGKDAVSMFMENIDKIQLVLLDIIMPKMNGKEAYEEIKKVRSDMKTIFMSGYTADILKTRFIFEDGLHYISKPTSPVELLTMVRNILDAKT